MRPDFEYQNHKNRQADFLNEAASLRLVQNETSSGKGILQTFSRWISQIKPGQVSSYEAPATHDLCQNGAITWDKESTVV